MCGTLIDNDFLKKMTQSDVEVNCATATAILKIDKTSYVRREWSDVGEMWHAAAEWHDIYGDEVKIETEKDDGLKTKNCS